MPRKLRLEYPGAMYHLMSRGDQREDLFLDDVDRHDFIKTLRRRLEEVDEQALEEFRRAGSIGSQTFRRQGLEQMEGPVGENHPGQTRLETAETEADRIVAELICTEAQV